MSKHEVQSRAALGVDTEVECGVKYWSRVGKIQKKLASHFLVMFAIDIVKLSMVDIEHVCVAIVSRGRVQYEHTFQALCDVHQISIFATRQCQLLFPVIQEKDLLSTQRTGSEHVKRSKIK